MTRARTRLSLNPRKTLAQVIAGGGALAAAYEVRDGSFAEVPVIFGAMHAVGVALSIWILDRAWREIEKSDGPLQYARTWYFISDVVVVIGLYGIAFGRSRLSMLLIIAVYCVWVGKRVVQHVRRHGWT